MMTPELYHILRLLFANCLRYNDRDVFKLVTNDSKFLPLLPSCSRNSFSNLYDKFRRKRKHLHKDLNDDDLDKVAAMFEMEFNEIEPLRKEFNNCFVFKTTLKSKNKPKTAPTELIEPINQPTANKYSKKGQNLRSIPEFYERKLVYSITSLDVTSNHLEYYSLNDVRYFLAAEIWSSGDIKLIKDKFSDDLGGEVDGDFLTVSYITQLHMRFNYLNPVALKKVKTRSQLPHCYEWYEAWFKMNRCELMYWLNDSENQERPEEFFPRVYFQVK
jgi:hypothetical protein